MGLFGLIPWKTFTQVVPLLADIVFKVKNSGDIDKEQKEINELKASLKTLDGDMSALYKGMRILIVGMLVIFFISAAALILGIIGMYE